VKIHLNEKITEITIKKGIFWWVVFVCQNNCFPFFVWTNASLWWNCNRVEYRFCLRHLYNNYNKKLGRGTLTQNLMMGVVKATYYQGWEEKIEELKQANLTAYEWLVGISRQSWCKHAFNVYIRCDVVMNNLSQSFNSTALLAMDKPIITMIK